MTDNLRQRITNIIVGEDFPVYEHVAKADLIIEVVEAPLRARIEELELEMSIRLPIQEYKSQLRARILELEAKNAELEKALRKWRVVLNQDGSDNIAAHETYLGEKK
jgi:hypothetical protein